MEPALSEDQLMFNNSVSAYLRNHYDDAERRRIALSESGLSREHWRAFAHDLGLLGTGLPEHLGGFGGSAAQAIVMRQFGAAMVVEPFLSTVVIAGTVLKHHAGPTGAELIAQIIAGEAIFAFAHGEPSSRYNRAHVSTRARRAGADFVIDGRKSIVLAAPWATHIIVVARTSGDDRDRQGISLFVVPADTAGIQRRDFRTISGGRASEIDFCAVSVPASGLLGVEGEALPLIEEVIDKASVMVCAEAIGVLSRLHQDTVAYTKQRHQFGQTLASFQVLQHRMVDMLILIEHSSSITGRGVECLERSPVERAMAVSAAKVYVGKALRFVGQQAIQLHGGMGMTDELALGWFFKRAIEIERQFGSVEHHLARYENLAYRSTHAV